MTLTSTHASKITIRPFRRRDRPACDVIYVEGRRLAFPWCPPEMFQPGDFERDSEGEEIWVAEYEGAVAAFLSVSRPEHFIHLLFVDPARHKMGIGASLLAKAREVLGAAAWLKCQTGNVGALSFYRAQGWTVVPGGSNEIGPWSYVSAAGLRRAT
jgi:GNAT superfamily N-acetyltransferase